MNQLYYIYNIWCKLINKYHIVYVYTIHFKDILILFFCRKRKAVATPSPFFFNRQFVAHGRFLISGMPNNSIKLYKELICRGYKILECDIMFTKDNVPVLCHDSNLKEFAKDNKGMPVDKEISKLTLNDIRQYNFAVTSNEFIQISILEDVLSLCKKYEVCLELDLEKKYWGRDRFLILYNLVSKYNMLDKVIWEVSPLDFESLASIDTSLVYQFDHKWTIDEIEKMKSRKKFSSLIILSEWFPGVIVNDYNKIIDKAHSYGFVMKCATLNSQEEVDKIIHQGVDLITTDSLTNEFFKYDK